MSDATAGGPADISGAATPPPPPSAPPFQPPAPPAFSAAAAAPVGVGRGPIGKVRGPGMVILLTIVTLGIYSLVWQYKVFQEMKDHSGEGIGGGLALVFAIFISIVNVFLMPSEIGNLYARSGQPKPVSGKTGWWILLPLIGGIIWLVKSQGALNRYWRALGAA